MKALLRPPKEMLDRAREAAINAAMDSARRQSDDSWKRAVNMMVMAMKMEGLSPRTAKRVVDRANDTVRPLWNNRIQSTDGDWSFIHELESSGYPACKPETGEM